MSRVFFPGQDVDPDVMLLMDGDGGMNFRIDHGDWRGSKSRDTWRMSTQDLMRYWWPLFAVPDVRAELLEFVFTVTVSGKLAITGEPLGSLGDLAVKVQAPDEEAAIEVAKYQVMRRLEQVMD